jgi:hypothetical protein
MKLATSAGNSSRDPLIETDTAENSMVPENVFAQIRRCTCKRARAASATEKRSATK